MITIQPDASATWAEPIDMLYACHGRVKNFCRQLRILPDYLAQNGINQAVKNDVQQILNYFNLAAPLHHDDEEKDFFPALVQVAPQAQANINELERQHIKLHENWTALAKQLNALIQNECDEVDVQLIEQFIAGYDVHIALEEPLFEMGKQYLSAEQLHAIGKIMAARRKIS
ncbi:hemerythrin HHE cation binding domain-containing protein [Pasteurella langaaensis DSM 22999]|uniref:Hemerythrin HHE cation binding domain-containing protein n=1 Tax=Alitibacter langaaensis DSM 22999 TaxID=1122935 RepID=A0A2U0SNR2_9PAST|nr:hemerythrin domain-containing protein [Pasteurella langaaensis]PVX32985.1 hemerythrin HHE cation binding domain-containing protein [Pasteurella langaaensis DSM 22999]